MFTPIGFFAPQGGLLLDAYPNAYAAWSLRKLRGDYTGNAIQVTRTSDSATQDIGFVDEDLDTSALTTFIGANTGVVSILYDQSGNSRDISIPSAKRPNIVSGGTLLTLSGGKPTMQPQTGVLGVDVGFNGLSDKTILYAGNTTSQGTKNLSRIFTGFAGSGAIANDQLMDHYTLNSKLRYFDGGVNAQADVAGGEIVAGGYTDGSNVGVRGNNSALATNTGASPNNTNNYHLFEDGGGGVNNEIPTYASEYVIYDTAKTSQLVDMMNNINDYYSIY